MLKLENENAILYCMGRSGSKSLSKRILGYNYAKVFNDLNNDNAERLSFFTRPESIKHSSRQQILVIRNPKERFLSGNALWELSAKPLNAPQYASYHTFMTYHGAPMLHKLPTNVDFKIIPFERLSEYCETIGTDPKLTGRGVWKQEYEDSYDWDNEMLLYSSIMKKDIITLDEFNKCFS